jgi:hypothetical protein
MTEVRAGFDLGALQAGAAEIGQTSDLFDQAARQIGGAPRAAAPLNADQLLDRLLTAVSGALSQAAHELDGIGTGLSSTTATYENAEKILANWNVPGGGGTTL